MKHRRWKTSDLRKIGELMHLTDREIGAEMGLSAKQIEWVRSRNGMKKKKSACLKVIRENLHLTDAELAAKFGWSLMKLKNIRVRNGILRRGIRNTYPRIKNIAA